ncbi:MAG: hypothetical protein ABJC79_12940 [Acidimicrobiia bacterium]
MRKLLGALVLLSVAAALWSCDGSATSETVATPDAGSSPARRLTRAQLGAFAGLGAWVDVYDYGPRFQTPPGARPAVTPDSIDDMARLGVRTLYLQAAQDDRRSQGYLVDRDLVGTLLRRAHRRGVRVVAWYLPHFADVQRDLRYVDALNRFETHHQRFDGLALDLEWTNDVRDPGLRNQALRRLATRTRQLVTRIPLGAIVLEPVLLDDINPAYWPAFPWAGLRDSFDVWLPMSYWTNRSESSGWRDGDHYASENIRRVRAHLAQPHAAVHVIGGIADQATPADLAGFTRAARREGAIGWSLYDYVTTSSSAWPAFRP